MTTRETQLLEVPAEALKVATAIRHDIHAHPELGYEETRTARVIIDRLSSLGVEHVGGLAGGTGVLGYIPATRAGGGTVALRADIDALTFTPIGGDSTMTWEQSLFANYTDGMLILHRGKVVYERYFGCLEDDGKHAIMSMTKSVTGLLAEIMVVEGTLDDSLLARDIIPEVADSAFATATVRQVMDMTTGVKYSENYSEPEGNHGDAFHYKTINSDMLGWIISRVSGQSVTDLASERL